MHYTGVVASSGAALLLASAAASWASGRRTRLSLVAHLLIIADWMAYVWAFVSQDYTLRPVYESSSRGMPLAFRVASSWAGGGGSLLLFAAILSAVALAHGRRHHDPKLDAEYSILAASSAALALLDGAFESAAPAAAAGMGLNPLLKSPWIYPHPLSTFAGYALISAAAVAAHRGRLEASDSLAEAGWVLLTLGLVLGGYWSYVTFGWGGYWAWDPVETAELVPWLALTAFMHVRPLDRGLSYTSLMASAGSVFLAILVTRGGVSPLHSFASARSATGVLTLSLASAFVAAGLRRSGGQGIGKPTSTPYRLGLVVSYLSLSMMFLFLAAVLTVGTVGSLAGLGVDVPQMDSAVGFFHPILLPLALALTASIPLCTLGLGGGIGWREASGLLAGTSILSGVLLHLTLSGRLVWSPASPAVTNAMISVLTPFSVVGVASGLVSLYRWASARAPAAALLSALHSAAALIMLGIAISGPFAYGRSYFEELSIPPGADVGIGDVDLEFRDYEYRMSGGEVDIYSPYVGRSEIHRGAALAFLWTLDYIYRVAEEYGGALRLHRMLRGGAAAVGESSAEAEVTPVGGGTPETALVSVGDPKVYGRIAADVSGASLEVEVRGNVSLTPPSRQAGGSAVRLEFRNPLSLRLGSGELEVERAVLIPSDDPAEGEVMRVDEGYYVFPDGGKVDVPAPAPTLTSFYVGQENPEVIADLLEIIEEHGLDSLPDEIALPPPEGCLAAAQLRPELPPGCEGYLPVPEEVPGGAELLLEMRVGGVERDVRIRFDVNGEVQGIHGLVAQVMPVGIGADDLYLVFNPPILRGRRWSVGFHELMVFYLGKTFEGLGEEQKLALASLLTVSYLGAPTDAGEVVPQILDLYDRASRFDPSSSVLRGRGISVQVKMIPGISLLWLGASLMVASEVGLIFLRLRRSAEISHWGISLRRSV